MIHPAIPEHLASSTGYPEKKFVASILTSGCINKVYKIQAGRDTFVLKLNSSMAFPGMFDAEFKGLELLQSAGALHIPKPISCFTVNENQCLFLEFIDSGRRKSDFFEDFGRKLAILHKHSAEQFGLNHDNYIGSLLQSNRKHTSWASFFSEERLLPQFKLALDGGMLDSDAGKRLNSLCGQLVNIFPEETPALLHGDLWSGNYMTGPDGYAAVFDPAVYYGHREMDLAMSKLFGGFAPEFYEAYHKEFPLAQGWEERMEICQLYPLLVHVNLFGAGYSQPVKSILRHWAE